MNNRSSGILLHVSSLPSNFGIGTFGSNAYAFVDFLKSSGQSYWQILPLVHTGFGNSPYQGFSTFAGNSLFIDYDILKDKNLLVEDDYKDIDFGDNIDFVDFFKVEQNNQILLKKAFSNIDYLTSTEIEKFSDANPWLNAYAEFMTIKTHFNCIQWQDWPKKYRDRDEKTLNTIRVKYSHEIKFWKFVQYEFFKQWDDLKQYANSNGIKIIGDIPIYVSTDSVDTWLYKDLFNLDISGNPICVAGCPPDAFSCDGQFWGNPIYNWDVHKRQNYKWWLNRIKCSMHLYDVIRIDHFRGFESYWEVPFNEKTAVCGKWSQGPGMELFNAINSEIPTVEIIAEDLGFLTEEVIQLRKDSGYPGMKVLQFAFDTREDSDYLPHNYEYNCIAYTGTHDNDTSKGWFENVDKNDLKMAIEYLGLSKDEGFIWGFLRGAWSSVAKIAIAPMQDFLNLGSSYRMNTPSTIGCNWKWRMKPSAISSELEEKIFNMTKLYGRLNRHD